MNDVISNAPCEKPERSSWVYVFAMYMPGMWKVRLISDDWDVPIFYKIGVSYDPANRFAQLNTACPGILRVFAIIPGDKCREDVVHTLLKRYRMFGEWFCLCNSELHCVFSLLKSEAEEGHSEFSSLPWGDPWKTKEWDEVADRILQLRS